MDIDKAREFARSNHRGVLSTFRGDGRVQMSPVAAAVDADGRFVVSTREPAMKTRNLRRDARASLIVMSDDWWEQWIQVDGTVEVLSLPDAMEPLVEYYRAVSGEHSDWDDYRAAMVRDRRVLLRLSAERAGPNAFG
jgi:PPOX class probable F420-dependent enzyme